MRCVKQWIGRYKEQLILAGVAGMVLSPFLWPFFLAVMLQTLGFVIPVLIVRAIIQKMRKDKRDEKKRIYEERYEKNTENRAKKDVPGGNASDNQKVPKTDLVPERDKEMGTDVLEKPVKKGQEMRPASCAAIMWYQLEGRERILRFMRKLEKEDKWSFSISPEGICSVREKNGYRRIGALRSFPCREVKVLDNELHKDRIRAVQRGKFLWLSWGKEYR